MPSSEDERLRRMREAMVRYEGERAALSGPASQERSTFPKLPRHEILGVLGEGTASVVYRARDTALGREVAVKILREPVGASPDLRERFQREAKVMAALSHPGVVSLFDAGEWEGRPYLILELVDGRPLSAILKERRMEPRALVALLEKATRAVGAAHARGIVHRDLKPANILVTPAGDPKVGDFGLAHIAAPGAEMTATGTVMGTPLYMAPEQVQGRIHDVSPRTDVYALGAILYELLAGRPPHQGRSLTELYVRIVRGDAAPLRDVNPSAPRDLEAVCARCLEKEPARRYANASELGDELARHLAGDPVLASPVGLRSRAARWFRRRRLPVSVAAAVLAVGAAWGLTAAVQQKARAERRGREEEALRLLETGRRALDASYRYLYSADTDCAELIERVAREQHFLEEAAALDPGLARAHYLLGRAWAIRGWEDRAEASFRRAIEADPRLGPPRYELGRLLLLRSYLAAAETEPGRPGSFLRSLGKQEDAVRAAMEQVEVAAGLEGTGAAQREAARALLALMRNDRDAALSILDAAIREGSSAEGLEDLHLWRAICANDMAEFDASIDRAIAIRPKFPAALILRASRSFWVKRDRAGALKDLDEALRANPRFVIAYYNRGTYHMNAGDPRDAVADFSSALALDDHFWLAHVNRGVSRRLAGDPSGAIADFDRAIELDPRRGANPYVGRAKARHAKEESRPRPWPEPVWKPILEDLDKAVEVDPKSSVAHLTRAEVRASRGEWKGSVADARRVLELADPQSPDAVAARRILDRAAAESREF